MQVPQTMTHQQRWSQIHSCLQARHRSQILSWQGHSSRTKLLRSSHPSVMQMFQSLPSKSSLPLHSARWSPQMTHRMLQLLCLHSASHLRQVDSKTQWACLTKRPNRLLQVQAAIPIHLRQRKRRSQLSSQHLLSHLSSSNLHPRPLLQPHLSATKMQTRIQVVILLLQLQPLTIPFSRSRTYLERKLSSNSTSQCNLLSQTKHSQLQLIHSSLLVQAEVEAWIQIHSTRQVELVTNLHRIPQVETQANPQDLLWVSLATKEQYRASPLTTCSACQSQ